MKKPLLFFCLFMLAKWASSQKIDSIYFHLYTDSLKKGFYNYINIDGKTSDGRWLPLTTQDIVFTTGPDAALKFQDNDLFIDSAYSKDYVVVKAALKKDPNVHKEVTIYIRKRGFDEALKTNQEILEEYSKQPAKKRKS